MICVMMRIERGGMWSGVVTALEYDFNSCLSGVGTDGDEGEDVDRVVEDGDVKVDDDGEGISWCCM